MSSVSKWSTAQAMKMRLLPEAVEVARQRSSPVRNAEIASA